MVVFPTYSTWEIGLGDQELHSANCVQRRYCEHIFDHLIWMILFVNLLVKQLSKHVQIISTISWHIADLEFPPLFLDLLTMITHHDVDVLLTLQRCVLVVCVSEELSTF